MKETNFRESTKLTDVQAMASGTFTVTQTEILFQVNCTQYCYVWLSLKMVGMLTIIKGNQKTKWNQSLDSKMQPKTQHGTLENFLKIQTAALFYKAGTYSIFPSSGLFSNTCQRCLCKLSGTPHEKLYVLYLLPTWLPFPQTSRFLFFPD